jgi:hypothetical protein
VLEGDFPRTQGRRQLEWFKVPGFSNQRQATVAVMLVKQGERLQVFLNKVKMFESEKAVPPGSCSTNCCWITGQVRPERPDVHQQPDHLEEMTIMKAVVVLRCDRDARGSRPNVNPTGGSR